MHISPRSWLRSWLAMPSHSRLRSRRDGSNFQTRCPNRILPRFALATLSKVKAKKLRSVMQIQHATVTCFGPRRPHNYGITCCYPILFYGSQQPLSKEDPVTATCVENDSSGAYGELLALYGPPSSLQKSCLQSKLRCSSLRSDRRLPTVGSLDSTLQMTHRSCKSPTSENHLRRVTSRHYSNQAQAVSSNFQEKSVRTALNFQPRIAAKIRQGNRCSKTVQLGRAPLRFTRQRFALTPCSGGKTIKSLAATTLRFIADWTARSASQAHTHHCVHEGAKTRKPLLITCMLNQGILCPALNCINHSKIDRAYCKLCSVCSCKEKFEISS